MKDPPPPKIKEEVMKTFEDAAFEMLSTVSPIKLGREEIPFDSVREIVLSEVQILKSKQQQRKNSSAARNGANGANAPGPSNRVHKNIELLMDEAPSSSSSSSHAPADGESSSSILERGTMTDEVEVAPRPIAARLYGDCTRSSSTSSASAGCSSETNERRKKVNYREKRLAEIRQARLKGYRENAEVVEFKCEENCLGETFCKYYTELLEEDTSHPANVYFRVVESLDVYFRAKTWESNCPKLLCEFLCEHIIKTCVNLKNAHDSKNTTYEQRSRESQIQVLLTLHVFVITKEDTYLDDAIDKLRMIFVDSGAERLRNFVEEPVTDVYWELIGEGLATIYSELCFPLPADLQQYENGLFKMTETDELMGVVKRRNGVANRLEQMLMETSSDIGVGGPPSPKKTTERIPAAVALAMNAPILKRSLKRRAENSERELQSPPRTTRAGGSSGRPDYKQFFVEDTPDEKYQKRKSSSYQPKTQEDDDDYKEEDEEEDDEDDDDDGGNRKSSSRTIQEEIEEEVKQTPVAKLRMAAAKSGKRCSKRLSDLVKVSEERQQIPRKARENLDKILEKAKAVTPLRSVPRQTRKSVLLGTTPMSSPSGVSTRGSARTSLLTRFINKSSPDSTESPEDDEPAVVQIAPEAAPATPVLRERAARRRAAQPARYRDAYVKETRTVIIKQEIEDPEYEVAESSPPDANQPCTSSSIQGTSSRASSSKWTDRQLKRQLGLTREDLNRYRTAMLTTGERSGNNKNVKINWENAQVNRAGRVKGAGASENGTPIFGIMRRNVRTMICHVLLNETNSDPTFDWNKVKFDGIDEKPRTRSMQSLIQKPEAYMESLKQKYIESKSSPSKKPRSTETTPLKKYGKKRANRGRESMSSTSSPVKNSRKSVVCLDEFGFETEADE